MPPACANPVATLARCLLSLMPTEHDNPVCRRDDSADVLGKRDGILDVGAEVGLVPAPHFEGMAEVAQQCHHLFGASS